MIANKNNNSTLSFKPVLLLLTLILSYTFSYGQGQRNLFFNSNENVIRLDFSTDPPTPFPTGIIGSYEGIAHYEDGSGNALFWFNANGVYDSYNILMPGALGILADDSSAEICISPVPCDPDRYYIFYNDQTCSSLYYSIVDMTLNGGLGDVTDLNTSIDTNNFSEGMEVIEIPDSPNFWLLTYNCNTGFTKFLISENGLSNGEVIYNYPPPPGGYDGRGELDYHAGRIGICFGFTSTVFVADFDPVLGELTNPVTLNAAPNNQGTFGIDFSPDGSKAYFSLWYELTSNYIYQYNFATASLSSYMPFLGINSSGPNPIVGLGEIELGRDGKLYIIEDGGENILVINNPDDDTPVFSTIPIAAKTGLGISDHIQSQVFEVVVFLGDSVCTEIGDTATLSTLSDVLIYDWYNSDDPSNILSQSNTFDVVATNEIAYYTASVPTGCLNNYDDLYFTVYPVPDIDAGEDQSIILGASATINATTTVNYDAIIWYPNTGMDDPTSLTPTVSPTETTTYYVTLQNGICQASSEVTIYVFENEFVSDEYCITVGESLTLEMADTLLNPSWVVQGTNDVLGTEHTLEVVATDNTVIYEGNGDNPNAPNGLTTQAVINPQPNLDAGTDAFIFAGETTTLNATGAGNDGYNWSSDPTLSGSGANPSVNPIVTTTYYLTSTFNGDCSVSDSVTVVVVNTEDSIKDSLCVNSGQTTTLTVPDEYTSVTWRKETEPTTVIGNGNAFEAAIETSNLSYLAIAENIFGNITLYYFTLFANPVVIAGPDVDILDTESATLTVTGGDNFVWTPADGLDNPNAATVVATPLETTTYTVTNTTANGCVNSDEVIVKVRTEIIIIVPTGFSPNGDNQNDVLSLKTYNINTLNTFKIYNRWGQEVYNSTTLEEGWDGSYKGQEAEMGVYVYFLEVTDKEDKVHTYKGNITLIR